MATQPIKIVAIRIDGGTQPRAAISDVTVQEYAGHLDAGIVLPPIDVFFDGVDHWLADGFHRFLAAKRIERSHVTATIHKGTRRDAILFSVGANAGHGLQRTNADKRKAVTTLLSDVEWSKWSDREIGERCGVSHQLAGDIRRSLSTADSEKSPARTYTTKHGTKATMQVERIGRSRPSKSRDAVAERRVRVRAMAAEGSSIPQIASALGISEEGCRNIVKRLGIDTPADRSIGKSRRHDSTRILENIVMDAEHLTADVNLIEFAALDPQRLGEWIESLVTSRKALEGFIRRLIKEQEKHGQAA